MITVACVRTGNKYGWHYVIRLQRMVAKHLNVDHRFVCITDHVNRDLGVEQYDCSDSGLTGWWAKMKLFDKYFIDAERILFFDLDTVICGDLEPLANWDGEFGICENFTRLAGHPRWPCRYGSAVMSLKMGFGQEIWDGFDANRNEWIRKNPTGDQMVIEKLYPNAAFLQKAMPAGYFLGYRDLRAKKPPQTAIIVFGGSHRPDNTPFKWVKDEWVNDD